MVQAGSASTVSGAKTNMTSRHTDLLVLGGGAMGTAAGWAAANRGLSVRVLERFGHIHDFGSHSGITRIFRHAYAEGVDYVPVSYTHLRAHETVLDLVCRLLL